jgi:hypothetical protein
VTIAGSTRSRAFLLGTGALLAAGLAAAGVVWATRDSTTVAPRVLVLAAEDTPRDRLPLTDAEFASIGGKRVYNAEDLQGEFGRGTQGILIESGSEESVDWRWLQARLTEGVLIGGININMGDLLKRLKPASDPLIGDGGLGWSINDPGYTAGRRFYAPMVMGGACSTGAFDHFDRSMAPGTFKARLGGALSCAGAPAEPGGSNQ